MRLLLYLMLLAIGFLALRQIFMPRRTARSVLSKVSRRFKSKIGREPWVQVYDTDSLEEARSLQARLEEEELECLVYEQGRKDVHGNALKTFGIAVPKTSVEYAQKIVVRNLS